ncbi:MAG: hypothetical protein WCF57_08710 [Pyrinomonadaceae bacterium]
MASIDQIISQIRFQLEQLSAKNAHHDFEHLCRHLTRARICSNILPATGPVSGGGDQGRDFETFKTYLSSTPIADSTFIGMVSQKPIAFACSLQKKIFGKIQSDVRTIMSSGSAVDSIHYFCAADVMVKSRHQLQEWARKTYSVELEIHDGQSISELLAERDVFWIAEKYLNIPAEIYPRSAADDGNGWYREALAEWKEKQIAPNSYADFAMIKMASRHALASDGLKQDLSFWISLLEGYIEQSRLSSLKRRAIYEAAVLSLRGLGTLFGYEGRLREYFSSVDKLEDPVDLEDGAVLLNYCAGSIFRSVSQLEPQEVSEWRGALINQVEQKLKGSNTFNTECWLLYVRGYLCLSIDPLNPAHPDIEKAIKLWSKLAEIAKGAPLFPLERFADHLTQTVELHEVPDSFFTLTRKVDSLLSKRFGGFVAAEKSRDRALALYKQGKILAAVEQLHKSKIDWFAAETIRGSLLVMDFISKCYLELGLLFAAKYYALAVAFMALHNPDSRVKKLISKGLLNAALCDYMQGAWCGFLNITHSEILLHLGYSENAGDLNKSEELQSMLFHIVTLKAVSERVAPQSAEIIDGKVDEWKITPWVGELLPTARKTWSTMTDPELKQFLAKEISGAPFGDLGPTREVVWKQLGITWKVSWGNDFETTKAAEQFIAVLQIFLTEVAHVDLCLLKTTVNIKLSVSTTDEFDMQDEPSNAGRLWRVKLSVGSYNEQTEVDHTHTSVFAVASAILFEASLLSESAYDKILKNLIKSGISTKIFVAQPYEKLYREFVSKGEFDSFDRASMVRPEMGVEPQVPEHEELSWIGGPGPGYSREAAEDLLRNRYNNVMGPIKLTLKRLSKDPEVMATVNRLRENGWLDWHILSAIAGIVTNYRLDVALGKNKSFRDMQKLFSKFGCEDETADSAQVPLSEFTEENLVRQHRTNMTSTLKLLGLDCHQRTPDLEAIEHFLKVRYNYFIDDIEHEEPFAA